MENLRELCRTRGTRDHRVMEFGDHQARGFQRSPPAPARARAGQTLLGRIPGSPDDGIPGSVDDGIWSSLGEGSQDRWPVEFGDPKVRNSRILGSLDDGVWGSLNNGIRGSLDEGSQGEGSQDHYRMEFRDHWTMEIPPSSTQSHGLTPSPVRDPGIIIGWNLGLAGQWNSGITRRWNLGIPVSLGDGIWGSLDNGDLPQLHPDPRPHPLPSEGSQDPRVMDPRIPVPLSDGIQGSLDDGIWGSLDNGIWGSLYNGIQGSLYNGDLPQLHPEPRPHPLPSEGSRDHYRMEFGARWTMEFRDHQKMEFGDPSITG
ncbi:hypothetical protein HGM15179_020583 [Zosterops borbonicus]|uniref:Uncharacterized protein n=1 Tax=Zosterops borbonicus TaxID=364589 RepID=A0A8K1D621_9PASS|nr:hypothetical protein HGM15179_020583 [Zosterops borbonicus]